MVDHCPIGGKRSHVQIAVEQADGLMGPMTHLHTSETDRDKFELKRAVKGCIDVNKYGGRPARTSTTLFTNLATGAVLTQ
jgi:hypothetical protein